MQDGVVDDTPDGTKGWPIAATQRQAGGNGAFLVDYELAVEKWEGVGEWSGFPAQRYEDTVVEIEWTANTNRDRFAKGWSAFAHPETPHDTGGAFFVSGTERELFSQFGCDDGVGHIDGVLVIHEH